MAEAAQHARGLLKDFSRLRPLAYLILAAGERDLRLDTTGDGPQEVLAHLVEVIEAVVEEGRERGVVPAPRLIYLGTKRAPGTQALHDQYREYDALVKSYATKLESETQGEAPLIYVDCGVRLEEMDNPDSLYCSTDDRADFSKEGYLHLSEWVRDAANFGTETDRRRRAYMRVARERAATPRA